MTSFAQWVSELPQAVQNHLQTEGFDNPSLVADSVPPQYVGEGAQCRVKTVDVVFAETIQAAVADVKPGTVAWAKVIQFYHKCHKAAGPVADAEPTPIEAKDVQAEEYYELPPEYRNRRLRELNEARRHEVDDSRLPSMRVWGRYERLKRVNREFEPVQPNKLQSEAASKKRPAPAALMPACGGALAWRLPAVDEPPPVTTQQLESWTYGVENLLFLTGWVTNLTSVETFHERFWSRVRHTSEPPPGYRGLSVAELQHAYMLFQKQWAKASRTKQTLDDTILASLPPDSDEMDGRLALAPRLASAPKMAPQWAGNPNKRSLEYGANGGAGYDSGEPPRKARGKGRWTNQPAAQLTTGAPRDAPLAKGGPKGVAKGKNKGSGKSKDKRLCKFWAESKQCPYGDNCRFLHN